MGIKKKLQRKQILKEAKQSTLRMNSELISIWLLRNKMRDQRNRTAAILLVLYVVDSDLMPIPHKLPHILSKMTNDHRARRKLNVIVCGQAI